jgi:hypothetical protein
MNNPEVRRYVSVVNALERVQREINNRELGPWLEADEIGDEAEHTDIGSAETFRENAKPHPDIQTRYRVAEGLITTALEFMQNGFAGAQFRHDYIHRQYLDPALEHMGWRAKKIPPFQYDEVLEELRDRGNLVLPTAKPEDAKQAQAEEKTVIDFNEYRKTHPQHQDGEST